MKDKTGWNKYRHKRIPAEFKETELVIESLTNSGDGLGRQDERVVFVPYTLPGDRVRIKITQRKKTFAVAEMVELLEPGKDRVEPQCAHFGVCGGCDWQHVPYEMQLQAKVQQLQDTLQRIGTLTDVALQPIVASSKPYQYRNRIQGELRRGEFHYKRRRSDQRIAVERCEIADEAINQWLQSDLSAAPQGRVEIAVVDELIKVVPINNDNSTELGFRQVNEDVSNSLTNLLLKIVADSSSTSVVDLYCGRGTWTNLIAAKYPDKHVTGVDYSEQNIQFARASAQADALRNTTFHQSTVEKILTKVSVEDSLCIVDPPRSGLDASVTSNLIAHQCQSIVYVSCHPATLARDLKILCGSGYKINTLTPLDMFPQTAHLECLVHLTLETPITVRTT